MIWSYYRYCCINEPVIFSHRAHLQLGHRFHALLKVCSDRDDTVPLTCCNSYIFCIYLDPSWFSAFLSILKAERHALIINLILSDLTPLEAGNLLLEKEKTNKVRFIHNSCAIHSPKTYSMTSIFTSYIPWSTCTCMTARSRISDQC